MRMASWSTSGAAPEALREVLGALNYRNLDEERGFCRSQHDD